MTIQELRKKYYFHDSCITRIDYIKESKDLIITMDFCQWAQEWYDKSKPENVWLRVTFHGIDEYHGLIGDIDYFSILNGEIKDDKFWLYILDDIHAKEYEYYLLPSDVNVEILGAVED